MQPTLFDLDDYEQEPCPPDRHAEDRWVLYYDHDGQRYVCRRWYGDKEGVNYEWLPLNCLGRKLPTRWMSYGHALHLPSDFNMRRNAYGKAAGVVVFVGRFTDVAATNPKRSESEG